MYKAGQLVIYNGEGVCRVEAVGIPKLTGMDTKCDYYTLRSIGRNITIYIPVNTSAYMRPVMTKTQVHDFIRQMPQIEAFPMQGTGVWVQRDCYTAALQSHSCTELVRLLKTIYLKQNASEAANRHLGRMDEEYRKRAEEILYTEFSVVLGIPVADIPDYLVHTIEANEPVPVK